VRAIALLGAGSAAIHQLRYAIGYGDGSAAALAAHPHGYFGALLPGIATAAVIALAAVLMRLARGSSREHARRASLPLLWLACSCTLAAIFTVQETLEGAGAFSGGGWIGLALALPAGLLVALALRGADAGEVQLAAGIARVSIVATSTLASAPDWRPGRVLDLRLGARAPPPVSVV
jgi:hypothetical protein